jgi:hypothetical protein
MILLIAALLAAQAAPGAEPPAPPPQTVTVTGKRLGYHDPLEDDTAIESQVSDDTVVCHKNFTTGSHLSRPDDGHEALRRRHRLHDAVNGRLVNGATGQKAHGADLA